jgi:capsular exopolysaccharide synthesis family protein
MNGSNYDSGEQRGTDPPNEGSQAVEGFGVFDDQLQVRDYVSILLKRRWLIATAFIAALLLGWVWANSTVPVYRSSVTVEVRQDGGRSIKTLGEAMPYRWWPLDETYATQEILFKNRSIAEEVVRRMDLVEVPEFYTPPKPRIVLPSLSWDSVESWISGEDKTVDKAPDTSVESLAGIVVGGLSARRIRSSRMMMVSMDFWDPVLAKEVLQTYVDCYLERNLQRRRKAITDATVWLKEELKKTEKRLVDSLTALIKFTSEHGMVSLDKGGNHLITFFNKAAENLLKSREQRVQLEASMTSKRAAPLAMLPRNMKPMDLPRLGERLAVMESEYSEMKEIYSTDYPKMRLLAKQIAVLRDRVEQIKKGLVTAALETAKTQERFDTQSFAAAKKAAMDSKSLSVEHAVLKKEVETNERLYKLLLDKSKNMELSARIVENNLTLVDPAKIPALPVRPRKNRILMVAVLLGLAIGLTGAFVLEHLDDKIRTSEDVEKKLRVANLGIVPDVKKLKIDIGDLSIAGKGERGTFEFLPYSAPRSRVSDAVSSITTSVFLASPRGSARTIVISSAVPGEGKTFVAVSLAVAISSQDRKVIVVDTDLRKPTVGEVFGTGKNSPGLAALLGRNDVKLSNVIRRSRIPGLYHLPAGTAATNPPGFLRSQRMFRLVSRLKRTFDFVIFDSPPVIGFPDVQILSDMCDSVILVTKEGYVAADLVKQAINLITVSGGNLLGVVLNMADVRHSNYGRYQYRNHYNYYHYDKYYATDGKRSRGRSAGRKRVSRVMDRARSRIGEAAGSAGGEV